MNIGTGGISSSYRGRYGSIGSRGFPIRTGVPGLTWRTSWGRSTNSGLGAIILLPIIFFLFISYVAVVITYNLICFSLWALDAVVVFFVYTYRWWKQRKIQKAGASLMEAKNI